MAALEIALLSLDRRGKIAEALIKKEKPELIDLFLTYQNEALAARKFLDSSLVELNAGAEILEVGGGITALAIQLASEGFNVTTVEPVGEGFSDISFIIQIFSQIAIKENILFNFIGSPIEECRFSQQFDFIFSINVMEHLHDPYSALEHIMHMVAPNGTYRFTCPNYDFPYEPHFGKLILQRKNSAFFLDKRRAQGRGWTTIHTSGLYSSLNFLTFRKITNHVIELGFEFFANKSAFFLLVNRSLTDLKIRERHRNLYFLVLVFSSLGLLNLAKVVPAHYQPIIDLKIIKHSKAPFCH
jgi:2-polyprenyl-3-methyl-5-hydroxy-6-metoxy-1,4-benzoquinol methylase